ncbi:MAG TPA: universal stress protein [Dehalococcoidia bacterium]|nr:universal stress protein [Dehalococcoidia bacterium]
MAGRVTNDHPNRPRTPPAFLSPHAYAEIAAVAAGRNETEARVSELKVLVPLDGSRLAENSLVYLDALRSLGESKVLLVSVVDETEDYHSLTPSQALERETNLLATYLREVESDLERYLGIEVETKVVIGTPAEALLAEAHEARPDLLVISTHGRTGITRWRLGSVADKLVRGAPCDTLVVGPRAAECTTWLEARILEPFRSVLVPLDGSTLAEQALPVAKTFADSFGSTLHLVRVVGVPPAGDGFGGEYPYAPQLIDSLVEGAKAYLAGVAAGLGDYQVETAAPLGYAALQLEEYIDAKGIDLVIMTSHGRGGIARAALGSVTDRLLGGKAPVLVVRARK